MAKLLISIFNRKKIKSLICFVCLVAVLFYTGHLSYAITVEEKFYYAARDKVYNKDFSGARLDIENFKKIDPEQQSMINYLKIINDVLMKKIKKETGVSLFKAIDYTLTSSFDDALSELNKALKINPKYSWIFNYRGVIYTIQQYYYRAKSDLDQAIELNKNEPEFYYNRATVNIYQGDFQEAVNDLNFVVRKNKKYRYGNALFRKAYLCENLDNIEEAIIAYKKFARYGEAKKDIFTSEKTNSLENISKYDSDLVEYAKERARLLRERLKESSR